MSKVVSLRGRFLVRAEGREELKAHAQSVMEELLKLEKSCQVKDSAVSLDLSDSSVEIEVSADGALFDDAVDHAKACIRTAIHAAGGSTPGWETVSEAAELVDA